MSDYDDYPKKKKKRGEPRHQYRIPLITSLAILLISGITLYVGINQFSVTPPERASFEVLANVKDVQGNDVPNASLSINTRIANGAGGGFSTKQNPFQTKLQGWSYSDFGEHSVCVIGDLTDIEGIPPTHFEYQIDNVEWGVIVDIEITLYDVAAIVLSASKPTDIKTPILLPNPVIRAGCHLGRG